MIYDTNILVHNDRNTKLSYLYTIIEYNIIILVHNNRNKILSYLYKIIHIQYYHTCTK